MRYMLEVVGSHGVMHFDYNGTIDNARKKACKYILHDDNIHVNIFTYVGSEYGKVLKQVGRVFYQYGMNGIGAGYFYQQTTGNKRRYRLSEKTGKTLAINREWRYL